MYMDYNLSDINCIKRLLEPRGFNFSKSLGQNFLVDPEVCPAMAELLEAGSDTGVLEIGPGIGVLTKELCRVAGKVVSVELDERLYPVLAQTMADFDNFELVKGDVMEIDLAALFSEKFADCKKIKVCANLPYYITSPILTMLLESDLPIDEIEVMVQQEAAERLTAEVGSRNGGAITVLVNYYGAAQTVLSVPSESFYPAPKVDSAVIKISLYSEPKFSVKKKNKFFALVKASFAQRRKTAVNSINATLGISKEKIANALDSCGLEKNVRAEKLRMEDFVNLTDLLF